jgi:LPXTG-site transpeptidase (sortase) family protein
VVLALGLTATPVHAQDSPAPAAQPPNGAAAAGVTSDTPPLWGSLPSAVAIPSLGTRAPIVPVGLEDDGTMASPTDPDTVGWYDLGPGVGAPGNAVLAGHVDWGGRLRAFGLLRLLEPGDTIQITDAAGNVLTYSVSWTRLVQPDSAPLDAIYEQTTDTEEVTLITCGGTFDPSIHMYLSRVIVRAVRSG